MKTQFLALVTVILLSFCAFNLSAQTDKSLAQVNQMEGLLIFTDSKPVAEYDYLGTVKSNTGGFGSGQYEAVRKRLMNDVKKSYPEADGIIIYLNKGQADKADAIRFK